ncbi:DUF4023 domain-containing protein [Paenibacillus sp. NPDC056579]|nr:DUF4023 domain-containing protein [Paenibacillus sp. H1-7]ULL15790.1 DUF4023 domain-containing protein [Paenibacillus sp. H1-7]
MNDNLTGDTTSWVNKLHDTQQKDEKNRKQQGSGHPEKALPTEQHRKGN